jgi:hypothetical protein
VRTYKECFVAFMDILGFKQQILSSDCETIFQIFSEIHLRTKASMNYNGVQIDAYEHIHHNILSDSVIVYIDAEIDDSFTALLDVCERLQYFLANREEPILLRGGITKGTLYHENGIIFGQGLTDAYLLEKNHAKYPRVIFTGETLDAGRHVFKYMFPELDGFAHTYIKDDDHFYFLSCTNRTDFMKIEKAKLYFDRLIRLCDYMLNKAVDSNLRDKYIWLKKQIDKSIERHINLRNLYKQEEESNSKAQMVSFNARFKVYEKDHDT